MTFFEGYGRRVTVGHEVAGVWQAHRQILATASEAFGVLIGTTSIDRREVWVDAVTTPMRLDRCSRFSFELRDPGHQRAVSRRFVSSDGTAIYLGTWHTHPEAMPTPSRTDKNDWVTCLRANRGRPLAFVIVGTEEIRVYVRTKGRFKPLRPNGGSDEIA
ncbi:MAG: Mov34/MPN/PAD-1 family protein [bacterium]|nr:Mov34/MPN/PAD-1 family protein [bacterium]